ncbi:hypothetical protein [Ornithinimicrobium kibberense]|uniref:hypothetical protein n=1 Tax=Ornithinimicrobium kibberense TaxID=282060 RepID=UPI0036214D20
MRRRSPGASDSQTSVSKSCMDRPLSRDRARPSAAGSSVCTRSHRRHSCCSRSSNQGVSAFVMTPPYQLLDASSMIG